MYLLLFVNVNTFDFGFINYYTIINDVSIKSIVEVRKRSDCDWSVTANQFMAGKASVMIDRLNIVGSLRLFER